MNGAVQMIFPLSHSVQTRKILLRNNTDDGWIVKLAPSSSSLITFSPLSENHRAIYYIEPYSSTPVKISLDQRQLSKGDELQQRKMGQLQLLVYCRKPEKSEKSLRKWFNAADHPESEVAEKFSIIRSKAFSALEVIVDLPGKAHLVNAVLQPSMDVDDSDCLTAHRVDSDTRTVIALSDNELLDTLPPASMLDTCRPPLRSPLFSMGMCSWMAQAMAVVFPSPAVVAEATPVTPPYAVDCKEVEDTKSKKIEQKNIIVIAS